MDTWKYWFTLIELVVSVLISVLLLGGIFYFMTDTLTGVSRSSSNTEFLWNIHALRDVFSDADLEILIDNSSGSGSDILLIRNNSWDGWSIFGIVDNESKTLSSSGKIDVYHDSLLWVRDVSNSDITVLESSPEEVYDYIFFNDKILQDIHVKDMQAIFYNSGSILDIEFTFFPSYQKNLNGDTWWEISQEDIFYYNVTY